MFGSRRSDERGFTLLETLVAFAIAAMALAILFEAAANGNAAAQAASRYQEAVSRAKSHLAALGREASLTAGESTGDDGSGYRWRVRVTPVATAMLPRIRPSATGEAPHVTLFAIEVAISWPSDGKRREVVLRTRQIASESGEPNG